MGADACLHLLDDRAFYDQVVPAFTRLVNDGTLGGGLAEVAQGCELELRGAGRADLAAHCTHLTSRLAWTGDPAGATMLDSWERRRCQREDCPSAPTCPLQHDTDDLDSLLLLFSAAVEAHCSDEVFLARTIDVTFVAPALDAGNVRQDAPARMLLTALGRRGYVLGYSFGGAGEGVHGWLDADEARALAAALSPLPLPLPLPPPRADALQALTSRPDTDDMPALVLARIRAGCERAADVGRGVAWINH